MLTGSHDCRLSIHPILYSTIQTNIIYIFFSYVPNIPRLPSFSVHATITLTSDKMIFYCYQLPAPSLRVPLGLKTGITHVRASGTRAETVPFHCRTADLLINTAGTKAGGWTSKRAPHLLLCIVVAQIRVKQKNCA